MTKNKLDNGWEIKFDKQFGGKNGILFQTGLLNDVDIKDFIRSLLAETREETIEAVLPEKIGDERKLITQEERDLQKQISNETDQEIDHEMLDRKLGHCLCRDQIIKTAKEKFGIEIK